MLLDFQKQEKLLIKYGIKRPKSFLVTSVKDTVKYFKEINGSAVLKIYSLKHLHRTDVGGVFTDIKTEEEAKSAFHSLMNIKDVKGVIIEEQIKGQEFVIGIKSDDVFGKTLMFGTGGVMIEIFNDVTFRLIPLTKKDASEMLSEIKGSKLLEGFRGSEKIDKNKIISTLLSVGKMAEGENIKEADFNPVIINKKGVYFCDAKIIL